MTREGALKILDELKNSPNMKKHALAVGCTMTALYEYFKSKGQNPEIEKTDWEIIGLLHDADYELTNKSLEAHTEETTKKLKEEKVDQLVIDAIRGHCDKAPRDSLVSKAVYAADELSGLIVACALVQPDKKLKSVSVQSVLKKFKDKSFAAGANRDQIKTCEKELDIKLEDFTNIVLMTMQNHAEELGL